MPEKVLERNRKSRRSMKLGARRDEWTKLDTSLRLFIYRHVIAKCRAPSIAEMAKRFKSRKQVGAALQRLCASHAFVLQENGELWRAAPFSAVPTAFPVKVGIVLIMATALGTHSASLQCSTKTPRSMPPAAAAIWKCC